MNLTFHFSAENFLLSLKIIHISCLVNLYLKKIHLQTRKKLIITILL